MNRSKSNPIKVLLVLLIIFNFGSIVISAQGYLPIEQWNKTFGRPENDGAAFIYQTPDGNYFIGGYTLSFGAGDTDAWLIKVDANGNMQWNKTFGGSREDEVYSIQPGSDNGYVMVGRTEYVSVLLNDDVWIISIDASGNMLWDNSIGGNGNDWAFSSYLTSDGGHAIAGVTTSYGAGGGDAWLIKIDKDGHEQWNKTFGETKWDEVNSVQQTSDGGYILTGITGADTNPPYQYLIGGDAWLIKTDAIGNRQWSKKFGGRDTDWTVSVQQTTDDGYILAGATESYGTGGEDVWLIKTDEKGNEKWSRTFGGKSDDFGLSVQQTLDGGYLIVGTTESYGAGGGDVWLIKTDEKGNEKWSRTFGGKGKDSSGSVQQTLDGGYLIAGTTESYGAGGGDVWLIKLSSEVTPTSTPMPTHTATPAASTPAPIATNVTSITSGFEVALALAGVLTIAYLIRRK